MIGSKALFIGNVAIAAGLCVGNTDVDFRNSQFARELWASKTSAIIIGDSTNYPRGAGQFVPYYEGFLLELPDRIRLCGFRISASTGNIGFARYVSFAGGQADVLVGGQVSSSDHATVVPGFTVSPPGPRNVITIADGSSLRENGRFASVGLTNLPGLLRNAESWVQDSTVVIRTSFVTSDHENQLQSIAIAPLSDHDGSAGLLTSQFDIGEHHDTIFMGSSIGLQQIDVEFENPKSSRVGILLTGDSDQFDDDESGRSLAWCDHVLFNKQMAIEDQGLYIDSVSIGGFTAQDHSENIDLHLLDDYLRQAPRDINAVVIWLGQNAELDEWTGVIQPVWAERIENIANIALEAANNNGIETPQIVLCTPPNANIEYPSNRFIAMNGALRELAAERGWAHFDLQSMVGNSLFEIDPGHLGPGPHPSESGSRLVTSMFYAHLDCIRTDYNGDGSKDFFDVSIFLDHYINQSDDADLNGDGFLNFFDVSDFLNSFALQC